MLHVSYETHALSIGEGVVIGHAAVVHGCTIEDGALIGIGARVLDGAVIERGAQIGAGAVVTPGTRIPAGHLALGIPARVARPLSAEERRRDRAHPRPLRRSQDGIQPAARARLLITRLSITGIRGKHMARRYAGTLKRSGHRPAGADPGLGPPAPRPGKLDVPRSARPKRSGAGRRASGEPTGSACGARSGAARVGGRSRGHGGSARAGRIRTWRAARSRSRSSERRSWPLPRLRRSCSMSPRRGRAWQTARRGHRGAAPSSPLSGSAPAGFGTQLRAARPRDTGDPELSR